MASVASPKTTSVLDRFERDVFFRLPVSILDTPFETSFLSVISRRLRIVFGFTDDITRLGFSSRMAQRFALRLLRNLAVHDIV
jgi:hypothetical protein